MVARLCELLWESAAMLRGEKIARARGKKRPAWSQYDLAEVLASNEALGISDKTTWRSRIANYENRGNVPDDATELIADALGVEREWLLNGEDEDVQWVTKTEQIERSNITAVRPSEMRKEERLMLYALDSEVLVWESVLGNHEYEQYFLETAHPEFRRIASFYTNGKPESYVLCIVKGTSMWPRIDHSELALVLLDPNVPADRLVVARSPDGRNFIKALRRVGGVLQLHPLNPEYAPITDLTGWTMKGGVVMIEHHYEPGKPNIEWDHGRFLRA